MAILPTDIRILFTNYDIIAYFFNLASCSEHFISLKHRIWATFNIKKKSMGNITDLLHNISDRGMRLEDKEQYSRQTSLRFHNHYCSMWLVVYGV